MKDRFGEPEVLQVNADEITKKLSEFTDRIFHLHKDEIPPGVYILILATQINPVELCAEIGAACSIPKELLPKILLMLLSGTNDLEALSNIPTKEGN